MIIQLEHISKTIAGAPILTDISYTFQGGLIYGLRGKNGCGKTMLMRSIAGLMKPTKGEIRINERILYKQIEVPDSIGILIENPAFLPEYTGYTNLEMLAGLKHRIGRDDICRTLLDVGLDPDDKRKVRKYSLGMKQRLGIAAAIMEKPEIILLDEPINAIDEKGVEELRRILRALVSEERVIIIACHDREELDYLADEVLVMEAGRIKGIEKT